MRISLFIKKYFDVCFLALGLIVMASVLVVNFLAMRNNVIFADESWYLCLLRDLPHNGSMRFQHLFCNVFNNNIFAIRVCSWMFGLVGAAVLSLGLCFFVPAWPDGFSIGHKKIEAKGVRFLFLLAALYWGQLGIISCPSLNYNTLKVVVAELGIGFMLIGLAEQRVWCFVASGFFFAFLFPVMITNVALIPLAFIVVLLLSSHRWRDVLGMMLGLLLFGLYYFVFLESPQEVLSSIAAETGKVVSRGTQAYGIKFFMNWLVDAFLFIGRCFVIAGALLAGYYLLYKKELVSNAIVRLILLALVFTFVLVWTWYYLEPTTLFGKSSKMYWLRDLYWIFAVLMLLLVVVEKLTLRKEESVLCVLLLMTPVCLSFGSNVPFYAHHEILMFITPILICLAYKQSLLWKAIVSIVLVIEIIPFLMDISGKNWDGNKFFGNHIPVETIGIHQSINLEEAQIKELEVCRQTIPQGKVLNSAGCWGMVCLLDYTPVSYEFAIDRNDANYIRSVVDDVVREEGHLWVVSHTWENNGADGLADKVLCLPEHEIVADTIGEVVYVHILR